MDFNHIWVEKYRPKILDAVILPEELHQYFKKIIESNEARNLLLYSNATGTGKTTMAKVLANTLNADYLYINASIANIDTLKTDINNFAMYKSFDKNGPKIVILDEADGLSSKLQDSLRTFIEKRVSNCRFIMTCNTISKISEALRNGRTIPINFDLNSKKYRDELIPKMVNRCELILKNENVKYEIEAVENIVKTYYPSMRMIIAMLQKQYEMSGSIVKDTLVNTDTSLITHLLKEHKIEEARQYIYSNQIDYVSIISELYYHFTPELPLNMRKNAYILISEYDNRCNFTKLPETAITALLYSLDDLK